MNEEQHALIEDRYGRLIHMVANRISGDIIISSHDDTVQDLWIAAMTAIRGYAKKEKQEFAEFCDSKGFDKYFKTVLWNWKNSFGARITKRQGLTQGTVNVFENEEVLRLEDMSLPDPESNIFLEQISAILNDKQMEVVTLITTNPSYLKPSGNANVQALSRELDLTWSDTRDLLDSIGDKIGNQL